MIAGNEANRVLRLETECDLLADFEVGEAAGLRQGDPDVDACSLFADQHRRLRAVEQEALDMAGKMLRSGRQLGRVAREVNRFGAHEGFDSLTGCDLSPHPRT